MSQQINLKSEQEVLLNLADIIIEIFALESNLLRVEKLKMQDHDHIEVYEALIKSMFQESNFKVRKAGLEIVASLAEGEMLTGLVKSVKVLSNYPLQNIKELKGR